MIACVCEDVVVDRLCTQASSPSQRVLRQMSSPPWIDVYAQASECPFPRKIWCRWDRTHGQWFCDAFWKFINDDHLRSQNHFWRVARYEECRGVW